MNQMLLWAHPVMQVIAVVLGLYALWQGMLRVAMQRGKKVIFPWKKHVRWGGAALILWTLGAFGFYITHTVFGSAHITGLHAELAWVVIALSIFGLGTGYVMNTHKKRRKWLPVIHGVSNTVLVALVLVECWTGYQLAQDFLTF